MIVLAVYAVYYFTELIIEPNLRQNDSSSFTSFHPSYTDDPVIDEPAKNPDSKYTKPGKIAVVPGFVPRYVIYMALGIILLASSGFFILLLTVVYRDQ